MWIAMFAGCVVPEGAADGPVSADSGLWISDLDATLRVHHARTLGTHNSYHQRPDIVLQSGHDYTHAPLAIQLDEQGVRALVLDVYWRKDIGFQVFHLPLVDEASSCYLLEECLSEIAAWSQAHPKHFPLTVWVEPKTLGVVNSVQDLGEPKDHLDALDAAFRDAFGEEGLLTPDDLRGDYSTVRDAVRAEGWPTLAETRGQVFGGLVNQASVREAYLLDAPSLEGRALFVTADTAADPFAAVFKGVDDPDLVRALVDAGFLMGLNADLAGVPAAERSEVRDTVLALGVHQIGTDFPAGDGEGTPALVIPGGQPVGCHPRSAPPECTGTALEDLSLD